MANRTIEPPRDTSALILVDIQPDFMPGGALAVEEGDAILPGVEALMRSGLFGTLVATQDWHPQNHVSFAGRHEGRRPLDTIDLYGHEQTLWPDHCVQGTAGARLHPALPWDRVDAFVRKGQDPAVDSYSGFRNNWGPHHTRPRTGLAGYLRDRGIEEVFICGLARDVCVCWTAQDAAEEHFSTTVLWDLSRPVDPANDPRVRDDFGNRGIRIADSGHLPR